MMESKNSDWIFIKLYCDAKSRFIEKPTAIKLREIRLRLIGLSKISNKRYGFYNKSIDSDWRILVKQFNWLDRKCYYDSSLNVSKVYEILLDI